jgi:hypothetical protein
LVRWAWMKKRWCKSTTESVGGNREPKATAQDGGRHTTAEVFPVRVCGMEAGGQPRHRTKVKPRKAKLTWVSVPANAKPEIQPWSGGCWGRRSREALHPYPRRSPRAPEGGRTQGGNDASSKPEEKSDHPIVATKLAKAGGAKGVMG